MKNILLILCVSFFCACAPLPLQTENTIGKNFDDFVIRNGTPYKQYTLINGDILFNWRKTNAIGVCELEILTSPQAEIKQIKVIRDDVSSLSLTGITRACAYYIN